MEPDKEKIPKGYKLTEVGVIPEDWEVKELSFLFDITSSRRVLQSEWRSSGVPFFRARELAVLSEKGYVNNDLFISEEMYLRYASKYGVPNSDDILITGVGTLGKVYVVMQNEKFYFKDGNIIWLKNKGYAKSLFIKQLYKTPLLINQISNASVGTTVGTYTIINAKKTIIPFPPIQEQTAIAEVLSDVDSLIDTLDKLIAKKKAIKQGAMQELLTGKRRLSGFSGRWEVKRLGEIGEITGSGVDKKIHSEETPVRLVNYLDVYHENFIYSKTLSHWVTAREDQIHRCSVKKGDVFLLLLQKCPLI